MKNNKGITLIALVITIIVLLILAGITIAMLTGENGLLSKSQQAVADNAIAAAKDRINLAVGDGMAEYLQKFYTGSRASLNAVTTVEGKINALKDTTTGKIEGCTVNLTSGESIVLTYDQRKCTGTITSEAGSDATAGKYSIAWDAITDVQSGS